MPELPEVEITTQNLNKILKPPFTVREFVFYRPDLRSKIAVERIKKLSGVEITSISRRAKFIIFNFQKDYLVSHLGMTGSWRVEKKGFERRTHDHIVLDVSDRVQMVYNDPRRFGEFNLYNEKQLQSRFCTLGPEPLDPQTNFDQLTGTFKKFKVAVKIALMNQKVVVGVGNIYASEALFRAGIRPSRQSHRVKIDEYKRLWSHVRDVLNESIEAGGSSIQDFRNGYGEKGEFQNRFLVYDRENQPCTVCGTSIKALTLGGRSTYWCPHCQS